LGWRLSGGQEGERACSPGVEPDERTRSAQEDKAPKRDQQKQIKKQVSCCSGATRRSERVGERADEYLAAVKSCPKDVMNWYGGLTWYKTLIKTGVASNGILAATEKSEWRTRSFPFQSHMRISSMRRIKVKFHLQRTGTNVA